MTSITVGEGANAKSVTVSDEFLSLTPEQQQSTANDIARQLNIPMNAATAATAAPEAKPENWRRANIAPIEKQFTTDADGKMHDTGEWRFALPEMVMGLIDAVELPGDVMRGEVDPNSAEGFDRTMGLAANMVGGRALAGKTPKAPGAVVSTSEEAIGKAAKPAVKAETIVGARMGNEVPVVKPLSSNIANPKPTVTDQALDAWFAAGTKTGGSITGKLDKDEFLPDLPISVDMKVKQAERLLLAAQRGGNVEDFTLQAERSFATEGKSLSGPTKEVLIAGKNAIAALDDPVKVQQLAAKAAKEKITTADRFFEVWMNFLLSGPQTHTTNMLSNALVNIWGLGEATLAAGVSKVTRSGLSFKEVGHRILGDLEAVGDGLRAAGAAFKSEKDLFEGAGQLETRRQLRSIPGPVGRGIRIPGRALTAEDAFFKTLAYRQEIDGLAVRNAMEEGVTGRQLARRIQELKANPTDEMMKSAEAFAKKQTFSNGLGSIGRYTQAALQKGKYFKFILPFFRTPVNLLKYSAERTPAGLLMKGVRDDLFGRNGAVKRDQAFARMMMGTSIGAYTFYQAMQGNVSGFGPSNQNERRLWYADGNQPYSIRVGDTWYSYSRLEPLGTILGIAGDLQTLSDETTEDEASDIAALVIGSITRNLSNKTWLRGPVEVGEVFGDSDRYAQSYVERMVSSIIPSALGQYARTQDPLLREAETVLDAIKERVPGYRETLAMRRDVFGEPIRSEGGVGPDIVSPVYEKAAKNDKTIAELLRLKSFVGRLEKQIKGTELLPEEWDYYSRISGQTTKTFLDAVVDTPVYKELPDDMRKKLLDDTIRKARDVARDLTVAKFKDDLLLRIIRDKHAKSLTGSEQVQPAEAPLPLTDQPIPVVPPEEGAAPAAAPAAPAL